jgi:hypothetical protein
MLGLHALQFLADLRLCSHQSLVYSKAMAPAEEAEVLSLWASFTSGEHARLLALFRMPVAPEWWQRTFPNENDINVLNGPISALALATTRFLCASALSGRSP